jgi:hypothetical protein
MLGRKLLDPPSYIANLTEGLKASVLCIDMWSEGSTHFKQGYVICSVQPRRFIHRHVAWGVQHLFYRWLCHLKGSTPCFAHGYVDCRIQHRRFVRLFAVKFSLEHVQWFLNCYMQTNGQTDRYEKLLIFSFAMHPKLCGWSKCFKGAFHNIGVITNLYIMYTPEERSRNCRRSFGTHLLKDTASNCRRS